VKYLTAKTVTQSKGLNYLKVILFITLVPTFYWLLTLVFGDRDMFIERYNWVYVIIFNFIITILLTIGSSVVSGYINRKLPWSKSKFTRRVIFQVIGLTTMAIVVMGTYSWVWYSFLFPEAEEPGSIFYNIIIAVVIVLMAGFVFEGRQLYNFWKTSLLNEKELKEQNLKAQLDVLMAQVNPHFLFNTLNGIYVLINKNPDLARATIIRLSDLLSHQIYETKQDNIPLEKEVQYLKNYIELEQIRQGEKVRLNVEFPKNIEDLKIPPLIFIPFVENAFKYGLASDIKPYNIYLSLKIVDNELTFICKNEYAPSTITPKYSGLGLTNVKNRLGLLFKNNYELKVQALNYWFIVTLKLKLPTYGAKN
jgi:two-component system LytT family sensor kinase